MPVLKKKVKCLEGTSNIQNRDLQMQDMELRIQQSKQ